jgi:hypothetical protein
MHTQPQPFRFHYRVLALLICTLLALMLGVCIVNAEVEAEDGQNENIFLSAEVALNTTAIPVRDRVELAARLRSITDVPARPLNAPARVIGDQKVFSVTNTSENEILRVPSTLRAAGEHIYLWVEDAVNVDITELQTLVDEFDNRIYDAVRELWGSEDIPGIDGDPRVHGLIASGVGNSVAAYFMSDNTLPNEVIASSNEHEMFLINAAAFNNYSAFDIAGVVAHEFQHMIRANLQMNEETWINEGFSEFTQINLYEPGYGEIYAFLYAPDTQVNGWNEDASLRGANYGAAGLFVTYFHDRYGLPALRQLSEDNAPRGLQAVDNVLTEMGEPGVNVFFADWTLANFLFDPNVATGAYGYRSLYIDTSEIPRTPVEKYPVLISQIVNQYATDYYELVNFGDAQSLTVEFNAPQTVGVIPASTDDGNRFAYSNRADMSDTRLTRAFDLTGVTSATLEYRLWYHLEDLWDYGYVMVSTDEGVSWDILATDHTRDDNPHLAAYGSAYTGRSGGLIEAQWVDERVSLDAYAGQEILVRFEVITDDAINQHGMAVDDIRIPEIDYSADFDTVNDWTAEGWIWTDNLLDQHAWVQVIQQTANDAVIARWEYPSEYPADLGGWTLDVVDGVERITVSVSGFAPVTTVAMPYDLRISAR